MNVISKNFNPYFIPLTTTFADCENTTSEIDIVTVTIPANSLAVGDVISIDYFFTRLQNSGGSINLQGRLLNNSSQVYSNNSNVANNVNITRGSQRQKFIISDITSGTATFIVINPNSATGLMPESINIALSATVVASGVTTSTITNNTFDNTISATFKITAQWASANANAYVRVEQAQAYIIKKAV
jgi:hypothetical protein